MRLEKGEKNCEKIEKKKFELKFYVVKIRHDWQLKKFIMSVMMMLSRDAQMDEMMWEKSLAMWMNLYREILMLNYSD